MTIYLVSDGTNDVAQIADAITIASLGTQAWTFRYKGIVNTVSGVTGFAGSSSSSTVAGPAVGTAGQMIIRSSANVAVATSPTGFIIFGEDHKYECDHLSTGEISWKRDDIEIATGSYTSTGTSWTNINQFFRASSAATARLGGKHEYIEFIGTVNANKWDSNLSGGTGNVWPTTDGLNQATLVNFPTDGSQWEDTGGAAITGSASVTMPQMAVAVSGSVSVASLSATIALTMPQMSVAASASDSAPLVTASSAFTMPQFSVGASAIASVPTFTASAAVVMPQMSAAISGSVVISGNAASLSFSMPQMAVVGTAADTAPTFSASIAATMPQMQVQCEALSLASGVIASINLTMPQMSVAAIASDTSPAISASVSFTMPQFSVYAVSGGFSFYESDGAHIETIAASSRLEYTYQSTHIEWRA